MAYASFDIPAGDDQQETLDRLLKGAAFMNCETHVSPEQWGTRRAVTLYAWTSATGDTDAENEDLENAIDATGGMVLHGEFLRAHWPERYSS